MTPVIEVPARCVILSGGLARRAGGVNKSLITVDGVPTIRRQLDALRPCFGQRIAVITDRPTDFEAYGVSCLPDLPEGAPAKSSLRGIASGLVAFPDQWCFVLAADMPWPDAVVIAAMWNWILRNQGLEDSVLGLCLGGLEGPQPFHAFYHGGLGVSARRKLQEVRGGSDLSLRAWIRGNAGIKVLKPAELGATDAAVERAMANLNRGFP